MERQVIITECMGRPLTALFEDGKAAELHFGAPYGKSACRVGEIYVGKVQNILPNIHGAFIEIGGGIQCYYSLEEKVPPLFTRKIGKKPLCIGDELLVQVEKEAVKTKQPVVTGNLNFSGKYVVLTSGNQKIGVSAKIPKARREELKVLGGRYQDAGFGLIFRTNAKDAPEDRIVQEIEKLAAQFGQVKEYGAMRTCFSCVYQTAGPCMQALRNVYREGLTEIVADAAAQGGALFRETAEFLRQEQPEDLPLLRAYTDAYPLVKCYNLESVVKDARSERVWMKSGAYLVIQPTEALTVIDVNSGKCLKKSGKFAAINREAAAEAARQIRLRNLSGIILIDFINLEAEEEKKELLGYMQHELNRDSNPGLVVDMTRLQLVEITRKKIRKTLEESLHE